MLEILILNNMNAKSIPALITTKQSELSSQIDFRLVVKAALGISMVSELAQSPVHYPWYCTDTPGYNACSPRMVLNPYQLAAVTKDCLSWHKLLTVSLRLSSQTLQCIFWPVLWLSYHVGLP